MVKHAFSLFIKIVLFAVIMLSVAIVVPYEGLTGYLIHLFDFQSADKVTHFILGEPELEVWESLRDYFSILINTLISIPALSFVFTAYDIATRKIIPSDALKHWLLSTSRRFIKLFTFTFLFWIFLRFLPYQFFLPDSETHPYFIFKILILFNLLITIACYWFITMKIIIKRSL